MPNNSLYGFGAFGGDWGGMLTDAVRVPYADAMLVRAPEGVAPETLGSASDNIADGWRTVGPQLAARPGADVLIVAGGRGRSIPLYAVDAAVALGAREVTYIDTDAGRLRLAEELGAKVVEGPAPERAGNFAITVDASGEHAGLACALRSTEPDGVCTSIGIYFEPQTPVPLLEMYTTGIHLHAGRAMARAAIPEVLDLVASGRLDPAPVTDRVVAWEEAATALLEPHTKLVFAR